MVQAKNKFLNRVPPWVGKLYVFLAVVLLPWTIYLGVTLPERHISNNWDVSWTGLDIGLTVTLLLTGVFAYIRSTYIVISSSSAGTLLIIDAWFDIMSARQEVQFHEALLMGFLFELPLALISFYIAVHALNRKTN